MLSLLAPVLASSRRSDPSVMEVEPRTVPQLDTSMGLGGSLLMGVACLLGAVCPSLSALLCFLGHNEPLGTQLALGQDPAPRAPVKR